MRIVKLSEVPKKPSASRMFMGSPVTVQSVLSDSRAYKMDILSFGRGVRSKFHAHDSEQVVIVTAGMGIITTEKEEVVLTPGDIIFIPAGEKHWHGTTEDAEVSLILLTIAESKVTELE